MTRTVLLGDLGRIVTGKTPPSAKKEWWGDDLDFLTPTDFIYDSKYLEPKRRLSYRGREAMKNLECPPNSIMVTCIGSDMGKVALSKRPTITNQQINSIIPNQSLCDPNFLYYLLKSKYGVLRTLGSSGGSTMPIINKSTFAKIPVKLPKIENQKEIAKILGDLDAKIELNRRMNETLEKIGQTLFKHYFIDSPDKTDWKVSSLDQIAHFLNGLAMQKYPGSDLPVIKIRELSNGITTSTDFASSHIPEQFIVHNGDVLFSWSGTLTVKIWTGGKGALNQHLFKVTSNEYPAWFYYFWIKQHLKSFIEVAKGKSTTMGHIQRHHLTYAKVVIPSEKEIERMGELFEPLFNATINNSLQVNTLTELRDSLLPRLVSGKLKV